MSGHVMAKNDKRAMNPDVPSLKACRRLVEAGYSGPASYSYDENGYLWWNQQTIEKGITLVAAPTIGEMLAEIRRRPPRFLWRVACELVAQFHQGEDVAYTVTLDSVAGMLVCLTPDALANALAKATKKEGKALDLPVDQDGQDGQVVKT